MKQIIEKCKQLLKNHYGTQFHGLILYGSVARNQSDPTSDIDLIVLLSDPFDYFGELRKITDLLYALQLESPQLLSVKPAAVDEFERGGIQLYRNVKSEGLTV